MEAHRMEVKLLQSTQDPVKIITDAASICYGKEEAKYPEKLLKHLLTGGHHSVFEHVFFNFKIGGVSRALLGQLTRHRHASYTVRSQRYCDETEIQNVIPETINANDAAMYIFARIQKQSREAYDALRKLGIPKEDARYVSLQAGETELYFSCNLRELMHINNLRDTEQAQWEIRHLAQAMVKEVLVEHSELTMLFTKE